MNVITVVGEQESTGENPRDEYYVVTGNGWRRLGKTTHSADLIQSSVNQFEKQIRMGNMLIVAHLGNELAYIVKFESDSFIVKEMNFDDVEY